MGANVVRQNIHLHTGKDSVVGYVSYPENRDSLSSILLIHEVFGLTDHIKDICERLAKEGYLVLAIDLYCREEEPIKSFSDREKMTRFLGNLNYPQMLGDLQNGIAYLKGHAKSNGKAAVLGFCMGGALSLQLAVEDSASLDASIVYYGRVQSALEKPEGLQVPLLAFYGEKDGLMKDVPALKNKLDELGKNYELYTYENADHAFFNDTRDRYDAEAAADSWDKLLSFLTKYL